MLIVAITCSAGGCHNLRSQLSALTGSSTTPSASTDASSAKPKIFDVYKKPRAVLDQSSRQRHQPSELDPGRGVSAPIFDWTAHGGQLGGAFGSGSSPRHQRSDR
ncbi:MAG: hypothetical protein ACREOQ_20465 [Gemmatimonadales bacterium]